MPLVHSCARQAPSLELLYDNSNYFLLLLRLFQLLIAYHKAYQCIEQVTSVFQLLQWRELVHHKSLRSCADCIVRVYIRHGVQLGRGCCPAKYQPRSRLHDDH